MMIKRVSNMELVYGIMTAPEVYPHITDDGSPPRDHFVPLESPEVYYLVIYNKYDLYGLYMVHPINTATYEIHTCLLNNCRGKMADEAAQLVLNYMFNETACHKIITHVPENNKAALKYALRAGLIIEGTNRESFLKGGKLYNQVLLGITREEQCQQQQSV